MKNLIYVLLIGLSFTACKGPGGDKAKVSEVQDKAEASAAANDVAVDLANSKVTWVGSKPAGSHNGIIKLSNGTLSVENGVVSAGEFEIDMTTVESTDPGMDADNNAKLTKHLRDTDFFDVALFPTAKFVITKVEDISAHASEDALQLEGASHYVTGNLTMKDIEKGVSFPAVITVEEGKVSAKAEFTIQRTDWGITYKSDQSIKDKFIHPEVKVGFDIVAN
ncbi:MAG: YceI family protein [Chitinophagales bacterium]